MALENPNTTPDVTPAPEGHDEKMLEVVEKKEAEIKQLTTPEQPANEPEKILGKFASQEELIAAYQALEAQQAAAKENPADTSGLTEETAEELVEKAGLDMDAMSAEYAAEGGLSENSYKALEKAGIPREFVDQYIAGVEAQAEQARNALLNEIGGAETFKAMSNWARANLSASELAEYNQAVESGDFVHARSAVMSLAFRYQKVAGRTPNLIQGSAPTGQAFASVQQLTAAMADPRYASDPAYRADVQNRLALSNL